MKQLPLAAIVNAASVYRDSVAQLNVVGLKLH